MELREPRSARHLLAALDASRGVLMVLGVFLHASNIYDPRSTWLVVDEQSHIVFRYLHDTIHVFRIPAFFWIAGYFSAYSYCRHGAWSFLKRRYSRLLAPLLVAWLTLNAIEESVVAVHNGEGPWRVLADGIHVGHLWFLFDLIVLISVLTPFARSAAHGVAQNCIFLARNRTTLILALALGSTLFAAVVRGTGIAYVEIFQLTTLYRLAQYAPYLVVGYLMFFNDRARQLALTMSPAFLLVSIPCGIIAADTAVSDMRAIRELALFVASLAGWVSVFAVLSLMQRMFRRVSKSIAALADASYSIYLLHHVIVVSLGILLLPLAIGSWLKFTIVCVFALAIPLAIHCWLIRRSNVLSIILNGHEVRPAFERP